MTSCLERDETLSIDAIASGPYAIGVNALRGANTCWTEHDTVSVPAGASQTKRVQLAPTQLPGC